MDTIAEFKIREVSGQAGKSYTVLMIHGKVIAKTKMHDVLRDKTYDKLFHYATTIIKNKK